MKKRIDYIDKAKGILIILTVIGHIWQSGYVHNVIYSFHMPAFFVISGMLLCYTQSYKKDYLKFVLSRIYSFGIPFVFIEVLGCLTDIIRHGRTLNFKGYIYNTLTLNFNDSNLWFLMELFLVEIIFVAVKKIAKDDKIVWCICVCLFLISVSLPEGNHYINILVSTFRYFGFFTIGFYGNKILVKKNWFLILISLITVFLVAAVFGKRVDGYLSVANIAFLISGLCGTYMTLQFGKVNFTEKINNFILSVGMNTIIIYGTHHIYYAIVGVILGITDYATTPIWAGIIMLLIVTALEIPTIYIINRWFPFLAGKRKKKK